MDLRANQFGAGSGGGVQQVAFNTAIRSTNNYYYSQATPFWPQSATTPFLSLGDHSGYDGAGGGHIGLAPQNTPQPWDNPNLVGLKTSLVASSIHAPAVTVLGSAGSSSCSYHVVYNTLLGQTAVSPVTTIATCPSPGNFVNPTTGVRIAASASDPPLYGVISMDILTSATRTDDTAHKLATVACNSGGCVGTDFLGSGGVVAYTAPTRNSTADIVDGGFLSFPNATTVANLPSTCTKGQITAVTDATSVAAGACTGGGSDFTIAECITANTWNCL